MNDAAVPSERVAALDALRGYAMFGVAVVNAQAFNSSFNSGNYAWNVATNALDRAAEIISNLLFAHRSFPLLAFLLGVGLVVQSQKRAGHAEEFEVANPAKALAPRYLALGIIGVFHGLLLWPGEVLTAYALIVLLVARFAVSWRSTTLGSVLVIFIGLEFAYIVYAAVDAAPALLCKRDDFFTTVSFAQTDWWGARRAALFEFLWAGLAQGVVMWIPILLGVWAARTQWFWSALKKPNLKHFSLVACAALLAVSTLIEWKAGMAGGWSTLHCEGRAATVFSLAEGITKYAVIPVLIAIFAWLAQFHANKGWWRRFVAVGRAPITMFVGQSVVFSLLFSHSFFGLHARIGRGGVLLLAVLTYFTLAAWIDQRYFQTGRLTPGERVWRWVTAKLTRNP